MRSTSPKHWNDFDWQTRIQHSIEALYVNSMLMLELMQINCSEVRHLQFDIRRQFANSEYETFSRLLSKSVPPSKIPAIRKVEYVNSWLAPCRLNHPSIQT